jgi:hypothetical protein
MYTDSSVSVTATNNAKLMRAERDDRSDTWLTRPGLLSIVSRLLLSFSRECALTTHVTVEDRNTVS